MASIPEAVNAIGAGFSAQKTLACANMSVDIPAIGPIGSARHAALLLN